MKYMTNVWGIFISFEIVAHKTVKVGLCFFRTITSPMEPHPSYKRGLGVTALLVACMVCLQIPQFLAVTAIDGICVANYKDLTSLTQKLFKLSFNEMVGVHTDIWNEIIFNVPTAAIGVFLPVFFTGFFNHRATTRMNDTLKAVTKRSNLSKGKGKEESNANRSLLQRQKENRKVTKLMVCITCFTSVIFLPMWISCWIFPAAPEFVLKYPNEFLELQTSLKCLWLLHSLAAPLFYAGMHKKVRKMFKRPCQRRWSSDGT